MTIIQTPVDNTEIEYLELSEEDGTFWKQIIPMNYKLNYEGKDYLFDKSALESVKQAFNDKAVVDQTAFQLANDKNQHDSEEDIAAGRHYDPKRYAGEIEKLIINSRGLFGKVRATKDGAKLLQDNPKLGVSASLIPNYEKDGKKYPLAMRHLLGTLDPKIKGMSGWTRNELLLSNVIDENEEVIDLTTPTKPEENTPTDTGVDPNKVSVDKAEYEAAMAELKEFKEAESTVDEWLKEQEESGNPVSLSNESPKRDPEIIRLSNEIAESKWEAKRADFMRKGVPMKMLDLATEVMKDGAGQTTINLSNDKTVDPKDLITQILHEAEGFVDLSEESGHSLSTEEHDAEKRHYDSFEKEFMNDLF